MLKSAIARFGLASASIAACAAAAATGAQAQDYDVLIRGGRVLDGTGAPWRYADVAISEDRIVEVGPIAADATADLVVDAEGLYVTPGFIDPHSHAVGGLATEELSSAGPVLLQGITTVLVNPDGGGPADLAEQMTPIEELVPGVNVAPMIGHNGVRREVMGEDNRAPTPDEQAAMEDLIREAMDYGAVGFSSGPFYVPGKYSQTDELVGLARVAAEYPGTFHISHIRDESSYDVGVEGAVAELIEVSRQTGIPGIVTHFKMLGPSVWGKSTDLVDMINGARAEGLEIWADQYPYAASGSGLQPSLVPGWAQEGGAEAIAERLRDPEQRSVIREEMVANLERRAGPNAIMIRNYEPDPSLIGMRLDEIARDRLQEPLDTAIDMLIEGGASIISFNMNEEDVERIMQQPWTMTSSDGGLSLSSEGGTHPRSYGAFPRKIREYTMERGVITLEQAIHSSSGLSASVLGIVDRGYLRPGAYADVLVFDPETIRDTATYDDPHSNSEGMVYVFVNGGAAVVDGEPTGDDSGRILLRAN